MVVRKLSSLSTVLLMLLFLRAVPAAAFCEEAGPFCVSNPNVCTELGEPRCHREITEQGLSFMRPHLLERTVHTNLHMDHQHTTVLWAHFDGCDFENAGHNINDIYSSEVHTNHFVENFHADTWGVTGLLNPSNPRPADAAAVLGYALHPVQDLYSHTNWVEITRGLTDPPLIEPSVDLWGTQRWTPLDFPELLTLHPDVDAVVFADENGFDDTSFDGDPPWQIAWNSPPYFTPRIHTEGPTYLPIISGNTHGSAFQEEECPADLTTTHTNLNKDSTKMDSNYHAGTADHYAAADLAMRQTAHEWCRILHIVKRVHGFAGVSVPMGFWVRPDASPHPDGTPCAPTAPGSVEISVDVDQIRVLNDTDSGGPGQLNFVLVLYTHDLTRSARTEVNSLVVGDNELVADGTAPGPVTLCLTEEQANAAVATVQAWDDDTGVTGDLNPDGDQALRGVYAEIALHALGVHTVTSPDMEVTFDIQHTQTDTDGDGLFKCDEEMRGLDPADSDTDNDGLADSAEDGLGTDPLDPDSDDDGTIDGADNCPAEANADQADSDDDGLGDVCDACTDTDGDGFGNPGFAANTCAVDNCPTAANPTQADFDNDSVGDVCDSDDDNDSVADGTDNCPLIANSDQKDSDEDRLGNACDSTVNCLGKVATIVGTEGNDIIAVPLGSHVVQGLGGNDVITGVLSSETLCGGPGNDILSGVLGNDHLDGGSGNDLCNGGLGTDTAVNCETKLLVP